MWHLWHFWRKAVFVRINKSPVFIGIPYKYRAFVYFALVLRAGIEQDFYLLDVKEFT